jgi:hypothetical protein
MRRHKIERRTHRHDAGGVHVALAALVVALDVAHVHGRGDAGLLAAERLGIIIRPHEDNARQYADPLRRLRRLRAEEGFPAGLTRSRARSE